MKNRMKRWALYVGIAGFFTQILPHLITGNWPKAVGVGVPTLISMMLFGAFIAFLVGLAKRESWSDDKSATTPNRMLEQSLNDANDTNSKINKINAEIPQMQNKNQNFDLPREGAKISSEGLRLGDYAVCIPQGFYIDTGHVRLEHNIHYSIIMENFGNTSCDAEVSIDGVSVGTWRVSNNSKIEIERPVYDTGRFTFYALESEQSRKIGLSADDKLGLVTVTFMPEKVHPYDGNDLKFSRRVDTDERGGTGLAGESKQRFGAASRIERDIDNFVTIHLRLVCGNNGPRPLRRQSTSIPSFLPGR